MAGVEKLGVGQVGVGGREGRGGDVECPRWCSGSGSGGMVVEAVCPESLRLR